MDAKNYYELKSHLASLEKGSWIFFDIDFTLIEPVNRALKMASVLKYSNAYRKYFENKSPEEIDRALSIMMTKNETELVDENLPDLIQILGNYHYVYGFTGLLSGDVDGKPATLRREEGLLEKGISFKGNSDLSQNHSFNNMPTYNKGAPQLKSNILYSNGEKGPYKKMDILEKFIEVFKIEPKTIVVIEDRVKNLKNIEVMLKNKYGDTVKFIGIHYTQSWYSGTPCLTEQEYTENLHKLMS